MNCITRLFSLLLCLSLLSCDQVSSTSTDERESQRQEQLQRQAQAQSGLPAIHNFQEKKLLKQIYELRDNENLICYAYLYNELNGKLSFFGKCLGYGIPYSTQYSNPEKEVYEGGYQRGFGSMPQAEPNGLFMPNSSEGTWLMMVDTAGTPHPVYVEPRIIVSPFRLTL